MSSFAPKTHGVKRVLNQEASSKVSSKHCRPDTPLSATQYRHALFESGRFSDIEISALGCSWHLHKNIICLSPYFDAMFSDHWRESRQSSIRMEIVDPNIQLDVLNAVFRWFYIDEIDINVDNVISVMATASMLQLDQLVEQCGQLMVSETTVWTLSSFYYNASVYSTQVAKNIIDFGALCVLPSDKFAENLHLFDAELMGKLAEAPFNGFSCECELTSILISWMFINVSTDNDEDLTPNSEKFWRKLSYFFSVQRDYNFSAKFPFLTTPAGRPFAEVFKKIYITNCRSCPEHSYQLVEKLNLFRASWFPLQNKYRMTYEGEREEDEIWTFHLQECSLEFFYQAVTTEQGPKMFLFVSRFDGGKKRFTFNIIAKVSRISQLKKITYSQTSERYEIVLEQDVEFPLMELDSTFENDLPKLQSVNLVLIEE